MLRIRHVLPSFGRVPLEPLREPSGGMVNVALYLALEQARSGHQVDLWGWNEMPGGSVFNFRGVSIRTCSGWSGARFGRWDLRWRLPMWALAARCPAVDVLQVYSDPNLLLLPRARRRILNVQTPLVYPIPPVYKRLVRKADCVVCCSEHLRQEFLGAVRPPTPPVVTIHNGVPSSAFDLPQPEQPRAVADGLVTLVFAGAVRPQKGLAVLLRALHKLKGSGVSVRLMVAGTAALWRGIESADGSVAAYEQDIAELADGLDVGFCGLTPQLEMPRVYGEADIVVVPSVWPEPLGIVAIEAMAAGKPVIASNVGGLPELVTHLQTGLLVPAGNVEALAEAIYALASNPSLRRTLGQESRRRARTWLWSAINQTFLNLYVSLVEEERW